MRGQAAVEYLLVFSTVLGLFATVTLFQMLTPATNASDDTTYMSQARSAVDAIGDAINTVYSNGPGAVRSVSFPMNVSWSLYLDNADNAVWVSVGTSSGTENMGENLRCDMDNYHSLIEMSSGLYTVVAMWSDNASVHENLYKSSSDNKKIYVYIVPQGR